MKIKFKATGAERKKLVAAVTEILNTPQKYLGAPTFAYEVGDFHIDKEGTLSGGGTVSDTANSDLLTALNERGFIGEVTDRGDLEESTAESETEATSDTNAGIDGLTIEMPKDDFSETSIGNLEKLVTSKAELIKKALGTDDLTIEQTDTTLRFPWFTIQGDAALVRTYSKFIEALCTMAKEQKRITAKEKPVDNEKYAFRCFLLRLGFIGADYKADRKILLRNLSGNGSFKSGERKPVIIEEVLSDE